MLANGTSTWAKAGLNDPYVWDLAIDPAFPQTIYASTSTGISRSTDGGSNWIKVMAAEWGDGGLAVSPATPQILYAVKKGFGVQKSMDWGNTWTAMNAGLPAKSIGTLAIDPLNPQILYGGGEGLYKSTNGGQDWQWLNDSYWGLIRVDPTLSTNLYGASSSIYRSTDSGETWKHLIGYYASILVVDPKTPLTIYSNDFVSSYTTNLFKSVDGGITWQPASIGLPDDPTVLAIDPETPQTLYAVIDHTPGVYKSMDGGSSWSLINSNLPATIALAIDPTDPEIIYAGTDLKGVYKSTDAGKNWIAINNGMRAARVSVLSINPVIPNTLYAVVGDYNDIFESTDGGNSWHNIASGIFQYGILDLKIDPTPPYSLYASSSSSERGVWAFTSQAPKPVLAMVTPNSMVAGSSAFTVTLNGRDFSSDSIVMWNGNALATQFIDSTQLIAQVPANAIGSPGTANISILSGSQTSAIFGFTIEKRLVSTVVHTSIAGLNFAVDGQVYASPQTFIWEQGSSHTISVTSPQAGSSGTRYVFANWSDGGARSHTITVPASATTYTANFTTQYLLITAVIPQNGGNIGISPASADGYYAAGTSVQITANAARGYEFAGWSGSATGTANPKAMTMSAPQNISAVFQSVGVRRPPRLQPSDAGRLRVGTTRSPRLPGR